MSDRIRVLRVIARMNVGGPARQVVSLLEGLDAERFDHRLLAGHVAEDEIDELDARASHLPVTRVRGLGRAPSPLHDLRALAAIAREIATFRPHVVHTHTAKAGVLGRLAAVVRRAPVRVHTFHGHLLHGYFSPPVTRAVVAAERALARGTTRLVAVGDRVRDDLVAAGIGRADQYEVFPPGISLPGPVPPRTEARAALGLGDGDLAVAFVARMTKVKRPDRMVEVVERLVAQGLPVVALVAGEGALLDETRAAAAALGDRVRFLGWRTDVQRVYAAADAALLTSDNEGMPVSLIEAALAGCPGVTTPVGSAAEVVVHGATGAVSPTLEVEDIAAALASVLSDGAARRAMGEAARAHAEHRFGAARLVRDHEALYDRLVHQA